MRTCWRLIAIACCLLFAVSIEASESREEKLRRERREKTELDWEWSRKYEEDWKAYLSENNRSYRRWTIASKDERQKYQMHRLNRGLQRIPFRHLHR